MEHDIKTLESLVEKIRTPFDATRAYELGILNRDGYLKKDWEEMDEEERKAFGPIDMLAANIRRAFLNSPIAKHPGITQVYEHAVNNFNKATLHMHFDSLEQISAMINEVGHLNEATVTGPEVKTDIAIIDRDEQEKFIRRNNCDDYCNVPLDDDTYKAFKGYLKDTRSPDNDYADNEFTHNQFMGYIYTEWDIKKNVDANLASSEMQASIAKNPNMTVTIQSKKHGRRMRLIHNS